MNWQKITSVEDLAKINQLSNEQKILIFKHSTRCSISATALGRLERNWQDEQAKDIIPYYLDLLSYKALSNQIADYYGVIHESPQVLLIDGGKCVYNTSHLDINFSDIVKEALALG
ncbi:MAG: bacillithiol system redox-active protein YtxJ [Thermoflexibacter sp.]|jgi:bacillithiol system protein YtxJ|nr:bacillithiol system redox-active protein YtxJ [Thermoflexibacter sp.]